MNTQKASPLRIAVVSGLVTSCQAPSYARVVRARRRAAEADAAAPPASALATSDHEEALTPSPRDLRRRWADLLRRVYEVDPLVCPRRGARMRIVAFLTDRDVIR